jgi:hypothetical protein
VVVTRSGLVSVICPSFHPSDNTSFSMSPPPPPLSSASSSASCSASTSSSSPQPRHLKRNYQRNYRLSFTPPNRAAARMAGASTGGHSMLGEDVLSMDGVGAAACVGGGLVEHAALHIGPPWPQQHGGGEDGAGERGEGEGGGGGHTTRSWCWRLW